jgi:hypothetical protein
MRSRSRSRSKRIKRSKNRNKSRNKSRSKRSKSRSKGKLKLIKIVPSHRKEKKYDAHFSDGRVIPFGAAGMSDYTIHKDWERMQRYNARHKSRENWNDPQTPGALSKWVLWNKPSFRDSVADFKRRFNL